MALRSVMSAYFIEVYRLVMESSAEGSLYSAEMGESVCVCVDLCYIM